MLPYASISSILMTLGMLCGLCIYFWQTGGVAFSPGRLSSKDQPGIVLDEFASHAEFEGECHRCHSPLETTQDQLCFACHQNVADQISLQNGTHAAIENVESCAVCHADHRGQDYDPTQGALARFDHSQTKFSLTRHYFDYRAAPMNCSACHTLEPEFQIDVSSCMRCHGIENAVFMVNHSQDFGESCMACHDGVDRMMNFDHQITAFPLEGLHQDVACSGCHGIGQTDFKQSGQLQSSSNQLTALLSNQVPPPHDPFTNTPKTCAACHSEPPVHQGSFSAECQTCHTPAGWTPALLEGASFDHTLLSGFTLVHHQWDREMRPFACRNCHQQDIATFDQQVCLDCHSQGETEAIFMINHVELFGSSCTQCHDGDDRMHEFDHARVFPLEGLHAEIDCAACHANKVFAGTPKECSKCHTEPDIHAGLFGVQCQYCHSAQAWTPAHLSMHDFPLNHGEASASECRVCHPDSYVRYNCFGCHEHQPELIEASHQKAGISSQELPDCTSCHPVGEKEGSNSGS